MSEPLSVSEAFSRVVEGAAPSGVERVPLDEAFGRVLAEDLIAPRDQPPFPASAMDGYAVRSEDCVRPPATLEVVGESAAGEPFDGIVRSGQAARIFTGAKLPEGADSVLIQENAQRKGDRVVALESVESGRYVRPEGLDFRRGDKLLEAGIRLDAPRVALAAAMNCADLPAWKKPVIGLLSTGDELRLPGSELGPTEIPASSRFALAAMLRESGASVLDGGIVPDRKESIVEAFESAIASGARLIVTTGGASVGERDLVGAALEGIGAEIDFSRIAMRPGKPMLFARIPRGDSESEGPVRALGLAGNPVSSFIACLVFVKPLVERLGGLPGGFPESMSVTLGCDLLASGPREHYMRAALRKSDSGLIEAFPFEDQDSSLLLPLSRADALLIRPALAKPSRKGDSVRAIPLRRWRLRRWSRESPLERKP